MDMIKDPDGSVDIAEVFERLLAERHSVRAFRLDPVPSPVIRRIMEMARRTPSSCNTQPWRTVILSGAAKDAFRDALLAHVQTAEPSPDYPKAEYRGTAQDRRRLCGFQLYEALGIERADHQGRARQAEENFRFFGAPHVAIVTTEAALGPTGVADCGAWVNNFMLAAQSLGVGSVAQGALAFYARFVRAYLNIPNDRSMVCGISFGYKDETHPANGFRTERASVDDIATFLD